MKKKSEIVWGINYDLRRFEKNFIESATQCLKSNRNHDTFNDKWHHAVSFYMSIYESLNGDYPDYNSQFMQALAMCDMFEYFFIREFYLEGEDHDGYDIRRNLAVGRR